MAEATGLDRVFIDTSELFPFTLMDVLLSLSEDLLFTWVWTDDLLAEWERVIVDEGHRSPASARSVSDAVRSFFGQYRIPAEVYRDKTTADLSPDPYDRAHAAACVYGDVQVLLTRNAKHFKSPRLPQAGVKVMSADQFLCRLYQRHPDAVTESIRRNAATKTNPAVSVDQVVARLANAGAPQFAAIIQNRRKDPMTGEIDATE